MCGFRHSSVKVTRDGSFACRTSGRQARIACSASGKPGRQHRVKRGKRTIISRHPDEADEAIGISPERHPARLIFRTRDDKPLGYLQAVEGWDWRGIAVEAPVESLRSLPMLMVRSVGLNCFFLVTTSFLMRALGAF